MLLGITIYLFHLGRSAREISIYRPLTPLGGESSLVAIVRLPALPTNCYRIWRSRHSLYEITSGGSKFPVPNSF